MKKLGLMVAWGLGLAGLAQACVNSCFVAGTRVLTPKGPRRIDELTPGDEVWSFDLARREVAIRRVVQVFRSRAQEIARFEAGESTIEGVTASHPFFDATRSEFVALGAMSLASRALVWWGSGAPREEAVSTLARVAGRAEVEVFNLEVEGPEHNYFAEGVLVHNKSEACRPEDDCYEGEGGQGAGPSSTKSSTSTGFGMSSTSTTGMGGAGGEGGAGGSGGVAEGGGGGSAGGGAGGS